MTQNLYMFECHVFSENARLVGSGGEYKGFIPVIQGDNTGPHGKVEFIRFVRECPESKGWQWEPQVLQMPHMNVLNLLVFRSMAQTAL